MLKATRKVFTNHYKNIIMKKQLLTLIAIGVAAMAMAVTAPKGNKETGKRSTKVENPAPQRDGYCQCGGRKVFSNKAYWKKKRCPSCDGRGYHQNPYINNGRKERCNMCEGRGWYPQYYPGYICNRCKTIYDSWND